MINLIGFCKLSELQNNFPHALRRARQPAEMLVHVFDGLLLQNALISYNTYRFNRRFSVERSKTIHIGLQTYLAHSNVWIFSDDFLIDNFGILFGEFWELISFVQTEMLEVNSSVSLQKLVNGIRSGFLVFRIALSDDKSGFLIG